MKIKYDPSADAMYITLKKDKVARTKEIDENTILDFDKDGQVIGVEILFVKERNPDILKELKIENLISV
ncbi:MAG: DUF2283 domain-containing protein [Nanoarchaeota archaeon]